MHTEQLLASSSNRLTTPVIISAIGTPLTPDEALHVEGLAAHIEDQWSHGINGILVAGTMGALPLLRDETYQRLARRAVELTRGRGEVMVGAGDCSFARTLQRIEFLNTLSIDATVVLAPYFMHFSQDELLDYYRALADASRAPLYLYDLPQRTGSKIELRTALELARHPNIRGIKCSDEPTYAREILDAVGDTFRVIVAQSGLVDSLLRAGFPEHLDGMFAVAPAWTMEIARRAARDDADGAAHYQRRLNQLRRLAILYGPLTTMTVLLNARGIQGNFAPRPFRPLESQSREELLADDAVIEWLGGNL